MTIVEPPTPPTDWARVAADGFPVPTDRPLPDLTAELTSMLGSVDPQIRGEIAFGTLATWIDAGVYDDLLTGLGDGMVAGLAIGLGDVDTDSVFRRSFSVLVLAQCLARAQIVGLPADTVRRWGDATLSWWLRERDLRGFVDGAGWAHAIAHGADVLGILAASPHLDTLELTTVLDVIADRVETLDRILVHGEPDRMALATLAILRRELVPRTVIEPWIARVREIATPAFDDPSIDPYLRSGNAEAYLRALYVQLMATPKPPEQRSELQLTLIDALRITNSIYHQGTGE